MPTCRFLLCNQSTLSTRVPGRQHSSLSQSSAVPDEDSLPPREGVDSEGATRHDLVKMVSTDEEVARLTIEVR